jgi:hypothetical protein
VCISQNQKIILVIVYCCLVTYSVSGVSKAGSSDLGNAGSSAVAVCDQSTCAGVDVSGRGISASHVVNRLTISIITGLCNVANNTSVQVGDLKNARKE